MSLATAPNPDAVHVRGKGAVETSSPTFLLYFSRLSSGKYRRLSTASKSSAERQHDVPLERRSFGQSLAPGPHGGELGSLDSRHLEPAMRGGADRNVAHRERAARDERLRREV